MTTDSAPGRYGEGQEKTATGAIFRDSVETSLLERAIPGLRYEAVRELYAACRSGSQAATVVVWQWLALEEWHQQWITAAASPSAPQVVGNREALHLLESRSEIAA